MRIQNLEDMAPASPTNPKFTGNYPSKDVYMMRLAAKLTNSDIFFNDMWYVPCNSSYKKVKGMVSVWRCQPDLSDWHETYDELRMNGLTLTDQVTNLDLNLATGLITSTTKVDQKHYSPEKLRSLVKGDVVEGRPFSFYRIIKIHPDGTLDLRLNVAGLKDKGAKTCTVYYRQDPALFTYSVRPAVVEATYPQLNGFSHYELTAVSVAIIRSGAPLAIQARNPDKYGMFDVVIVGDDKFHRIKHFWTALRGGAVPPIPKEQAPYWFDEYNETLDLIGDLKKYLESI